jgi:hypothetical protein
MKRVFKYSLNMYGVTEIQMPAGAEVLSFGVQPPVVPVVWALVDPDAPLEDRRFCVVFTGDGPPDGAIFVGTYTTRLPEGTPIVWHLFRDG